MRPVPRSGFTHGSWVLVALAALLGSALLAGDAGAPLCVDAPLTWLRNGAGVLAVAWFIAALGYGSALRARLFPGMAVDDSRRGALGAALGIAALLAIDSLLASVRWFGAGGAASMMLAATPIILGLACGAHTTLKRLAERDRRQLFGIPKRHAARWLTPWAAWIALPTLAAFALAAAIPPGLLWSTEFGGYDALSYHLQVPREWLQLGAAVPLRHNVYSAFPGFVESATLSLFAMGQWTDVRALGVSAQMLHVLLAISAAWITGATAGSCARAAGASATFAHAFTWGFVIGIPWMLVTGSLAYNEMGMLVGFAGALLAWQCRDATGASSSANNWRVGTAVGLTVGAAVGSKLTAVGMVAVPVVAWTLLAPGARTASWLRSAGVAALCATALLLPWMIRNAATTSVTGGNPFFPFASAVFGSGWWDAGQAERFASGHGASGGLVDRLREFWQQGLVYGLGRPPNLDPWLPQWSVAWWIALASAAVLVVRKRGRLALAAFAMLLAQIAFWMFATHMKSRFLLPCVVPMGILVGAAAAELLGASTMPLTWRRKAVLATASIVLVIWCLQPLNLFMYDRKTQFVENGVERGALPFARACGFDGVLACGGPADISIEVPNPRAPIPTVWAANHAIPPRSRLAAEGEASVFWFAETPLYGTVWDGGPLTQSFRQHGDKPLECIRELAAMGATHVVVNNSMLDRWNASGWLDPAISPGRLQSLVARLRAVRPVMEGGTLYEIK